ncbi:Uncharacterised protein [uncultured archaeon]|nr:Uncharacterised protein [uncultured archaeon]
MTHIQEYKKQGIYISIGLLVLLFPFFDTFYLLLAFIAGALIFSRLPPGSPVFAILAREPDIKEGKLTGLVQLFFITALLLLVSLLVGQAKLPLFIIGGAFVITTFGDGISDIINIHDKAKNNKKENNMKIYSAKSSIVFLISGGIFAFLAEVWILEWSRAVYYPVPYGMLFFLAMLGAITGALLESVTVTEDNIIIPLGSAMTMWLFYAFRSSYNIDAGYLITILIFAFILGYLAYRVRIADISAMLSATLFGVVIIISSNISWFFILLSFFFLGSLFTRYKYKYKQSHGIAEEKGGARGYKNVFSNSLAALSLAVAYKIFFPSHNMLLLSAYLGSIATACGDTLASEIGQTYKGEPRMITTFKKVRPGTDGAVSRLGEGAAFFGASVISLLAVVLIPGIHNTYIIVIAAIAGGFIGTNIDSVLGATLQQKGYLSNNGVNLFATISGAIVSGIIYLAGS